MIVGKDLPKTIQIPLDLKLHTVKVMSTYLLLICVPNYIFVMYILNPHTSPIKQVVLFCFYEVVFKLVSCLGFKPEILHVLSKWSTSELHSPA